MKFALLLLLSPLLWSLSAHAQTDGSDDNIVPFAVNMRVEPFTDPYFVVAASLLDDRIMESLPDQVTMAFPSVTAAYRKGIVVVNGNEDVIAYIVSGGTIQSTDWRMVFDPEMTGQQRRQILALVEPYVQTELGRASATWLQYTLLEPTGVQEPPLRIDFVNGDDLARTWLVSVFGKYQNVIVEDSARKSKYNLAAIAADGPAATSDKTIYTNNVIRGFDFRSVYSPNLKQRIKFGSDGIISVFTVKTGALLTMILPPETGIPKIRYMGASLQVDYGPGKSRYFYNSGDYKLLYSTKNYAPPARPSPNAIGAGLRCTDLFRL